LLAIRSIAGYQGPAGDQGRCWSSKVLLVIKGAAVHEGLCWSSGALLALPYLAGG
jgi:hypothetical protein